MLKLRWKPTFDDFKGFLDHGTSLTGELTYSGTLRVDGDIHGSITTADVLVIGEQATIHADITAGEVQIYGTVCGNIKGNRRVEICSTGRLRGDVRTPQLVIEEGGVFEGRSLETSDIKTEETAPDFTSDDTTQTSPSAETTKRRDWPDNFVP